MVEAGRLSFSTIGYGVWIRFSGCLHPGITGNGGIMYKMPLEYLVFLLGQSLNHLLLGLVNQTLVTYFLGRDRLMCSSSVLHLLLGLLAPR